jgi:hypothetical protein
MVKMRYNDTNNNQFTNNLAAYASKRYRMNSAYDPDPNLGSGSIAGFSEWAAFYGNYRVNGIMYEISIVNKEPVPLQVVIAPTITDVGSNYSAINELSEVPFAKSQIVSNSGGMDRCRFKGYIPMHEILGDKLKYKSDPQFSGLTTGNPSTMFYLNVGAWTLGGAFSGQGVGMTLRFTYYVEFFGRKTLVA